MEFSSIVLMEVDSENKFVKELGSYRIEDGGELIRKLFYKEDKVFIQYYPGRDVEDWEYSALFDFFDLDIFEEKGYIIEEKDDEYNPIWVVSIKYLEDRTKLSEKLSEVSILFKKQIELAFEESNENKEEYLEENGVEIEE
ncbi:DUF6762 family protein [Clostridium grantii]|uniref:Uncharacterized protein n=1 Tax=Clostridium grantii DSM 8605 TaxID=1121316 RepID=A0A1M5UVG7_9CLOT|nr:DUF6762 family protein [Clostridium grantii]SHH66965.1 hypothetical protein SAMN02745207_01928 [Clostridium grantii DSM 8605]